MPINLFIIQLIVLFIPGIIWEKLDKTYLSKIRPDKTTFILRSFFFGIISYVFSYGIYYAIGWSIYFPKMEFNGKQEYCNHDMTLIFNKEIIICILITSIISVILFILWALLIKTKFFVRIISFLGFSNRVGDEDIWDLTLSAYTNKNNVPPIVTIRDFEKG